MRGRTLKQLAAIAVILSLSGTVFEQIGRYRDQKRFEQIGRSVSIGGRALNISCLGQGNPTVIFDTYGHQSGYSWIAVQNALAKYTQACWYDRAGYGWSELGSSPRTFQSVASDLHALLREARIPSPVVLVGAGDAASHIRVYSGAYPTQVRGIVVLDANDVDDPTLKIPDSEKGGFQRYFGTWASGARRATCWARPFLGRVGIIRFANLFSRPRNTNSVGLTAEQQAELNDLSDNATTQQVTEACAREKSMKQLRAVGGLRNIPLVVIVSNAGRFTSNSQDATKLVWQKDSPDKVSNALAGLSTNSRVVLIDGDLTVEAIVRPILDVLRTDQGSR